MRTAKRDWQALRSHEDESGTFCVDIFVRPDGSYGFETFRKDPEDQGRWTMLGHYAAASFASLEEAHAAAARAVPWYGHAVRGT